MKPWLIAFFVLFAFAGIFGLYPESKFLAIIFVILAIIAFIVAVLRSKPQEIQIQIEKQSQITEAEKRLRFEHQKIRKERRCRFETAAKKFDIKTISRIKNQINAILPHLHLPWQFPEMGSLGFSGVVG